MSKVVKKVFKPIGKVFKGVKNAVSKVWDKVKKPLMIAAAVYLTAGIGMAAYGAATGAATGLGGSLSYGFGSVNSFLGFGAANSATSTVGSGLGTTTGTAGTQAVTAESLKAQLATGLQQGSTGISYSSTAGGSVVGNSTAAAASPISYSSSVGGSVVNGGATGAGAAAGAGANAVTAESLQQLASTGLAQGGGAAANAGVQMTSNIAQKGFLESLGNFGTDIVRGNIGEAAGSMGDAIGAAWNGMTGTTGKALLASNLLTAGGNYLTARDAEKQAERERLRRTYYGVDGYGNATDVTAPGASAPRLKPQTIDDLINQTRGG